MAEKCDSAFKLQFVLESLQRDTTIEKAWSRYGLAPSVLHKWLNAKSGLLYSAEAYII